MILCDLLAIGYFTAVTIQQFIAKRSLRTPNESEIMFPCFPFRLGIGSLVPTFMGQNEDGTISVALFEKERRWVAVLTEPAMRMEGWVGEEYRVLESI